MGCIQSTANSPTRVQNRYSDTSPSPRQPLRNGGRQDDDVVILFDPADCKKVETNCKKEEEARAVREASERQEHEARMKRKSEEQKAMDERKEEEYLQHERDMALERERIREESSKSANVLVL